VSFPDYAIATDTANGALNPRSMHAEIEALSFGSAVFQGLTVDDGSFSVVFDIDPSAAEKTSVDNAVAAHSGPTSLEVAKSLKAAAIDARTEALISEGFTFSSKQFSLSVNSQLKLIGAFAARSDPAMTYPIKWNNKDDTDTISIADAAGLLSFYLTGVAAMRGHLDSGTALKDDVRAASTVAEVEAITDTR
jgi:hypothetical protein